jgi:hypothetical protein
VYYDDDVTDLWDSRQGVSREAKQSVLRLEDWFAVSRGNRTVLSGLIYGHHKIEDGRRISTSTVKDFQTDENGGLYLVTQNSRYSLGKELEVNNIESCFGKETIHSKSI